MGDRWVAAPVRWRHAMAGRLDTARVVWDGPDAFVVSTDAALVRAELEGAQLRTLPGGAAEVSPDGRRAARVIDASAGIVEVLDTRDGHRAVRLATRLSAVTVVGWVDGHGGLALRDAAGHLELWDIEHDRRQARCAPCEARGEPAGWTDDALGASPDGRLFTTRRWDLDPRGRRVDVLDATTGAVRATLATCGFDVEPDMAHHNSRLTWSPDGRHLALECIHIGIAPSVGVFRLTELYDTASWARLATVGGELSVGNAFFALGFSADGSALFTWSTSSWNGEVVDATTGAERAKLRGTAGRPSPDGRLVLGPDGLVRLVATAGIVAGFGASGHFDDLFRADDGALTMPSGERLGPLGPAVRVLAAPAGDRVELVRVADGARLEVEQQWLGQPVRLVSDKTGRFDCDDATLAQVLVRGPDPGAPWVAAATSPLARRVSGLLSSFVAGR